MRPFAQWKWSTIYVVVQEKRRVVNRGRAATAAWAADKRQHRNDFTSRFLLVVSAVAASLGRSFLFDGEPIEPASTTSARG